MYNCTSVVVIIGNYLTFYKLHFNSEAKGLISMGYTGGPFYRNKLVQRTDKVGLVVGICQIYLSELYTKLYMVFVCMCPYYKI